MIDGGIDWQGWGQVALGAVLGGGGAAYLTNRQYGAAASRREDRKRILDEHALVLLDTIQAGLHEVGAADGIVATDPAVSRSFVDHERRIRNLALRIGHRDHRRYRRCQRILDSVTIRSGESDGGTDVWVEFSRKDDGEALSEAELRRCLIEMLFFQRYLRRTFMPRWNRCARAMIDGYQYRKDRIGAGLAPREPRAWSAGLRRRADARRQ